MSKWSLWGAVLVAAGEVASVGAADTGVALTVYNGDFGVVRERRELDVPGAGGQVRFTDVAAQIDGTSVQFRSLTDPEAHVVEQNFEYDLVSADKLLQKYVDRDVVVTTADGSRYSGRLLSFSGQQLVLEEAGDVVVVERDDNVKDIRLGELPDGLITRPTLVWTVDTRSPGRQLVEVSYQTTGINWRADYTAVLDASDTALDLNGWVTLDNRSGATYPDARLKLIAGDVRRAQPSPKDRAPRRVMMAEAAAPGFEEKSFFEYHLYTLGRPTTVGQGQTKQIELLSAAGVPVRKTFLFDGVPGYRFRGGVTTEPSFGSEVSTSKAKVLIELTNRKSDGLGMPLPRGRVRLYKRDQDDAALELVGEDWIDHTPRDERITLYVGDAFDVVGERKRVDYQIDKGRRTMTETFRIELRNRKDDAVRVLVKETLYRASNWEIVRSDAEYEKFDSNTIHCELDVAAGAERTFEYTVRYTW